MNDFEFRARAAARAIRDAIDTPVSLTTRPTKSRGPIRALAVAAIVTAVTVIGTALIVNARHTDGPASDVTSFCGHVDALISHPVTPTDNEPQSVEWLRDAPTEIHDVALAVLAAQAQHRTVARPDSTRFLNWYEVNCFPDAAQPNAGPAQQRYIPGGPTTLFNVCGAYNGPRVADNVSDGFLHFGHITIIGNGAIADPYTNAMIGLAWSPAESAGSPPVVEPVTVPGHPKSSISSILGPFGIPLDGVGQRVSWVDGNRAISVYGRGYGPDRTQDLIALASHVTVDQSGPHLAAAYLPSGYTTIFDGPLATAAFGSVGPSGPSTGFSITANGGSANLVGVVESGAEFEAVRFFAVDLAPTVINGYPALAGTLATEDSRRLVKWHLPNGVALALTSGARGTDRGLTLVVMTGMASDSGPVSRAEWESVINRGTGCFLSEGVTSSGTTVISSSGQSSSATSSTSRTSGSPRP